jgi:plasmid maintenance system antidote protein VapI
MATTMPENYEVVTIEGEHYVPLGDYLRLEATAAPYTWDRPAFSPLGEMLRSAMAARGLTADDLVNCTELTTLEVAALVSTDPADIPPLSPVVAAQLHYLTGIASHTWLALGRDVS